MPLLFGTRCLRSCWTIKRSNVSGTQCLGSVEHGATSFGTRCLRSSWTIKRSINPGTRCRLIWHAMPQPRHSLPLLGTRCPQIGTRSLSKNPPTSLVCGHALLVRAFWGPCTARARPPFPFSCASFSCVFLSLRLFVCGLCGGSGGQI